MRKRSTPNARRTLKTQTRRNDAVQHILVVNDGTILGEGITHFLASKPGLKVTSVGVENEESVIKSFYSTHPDVVVICQETSANIDHIPVLLKEKTTRDNFKIVVVSADSNMIHVYENQQRRELRGEEFLGLFQNAKMK